MSRFEQLFTRLAKAQKKALGVYITVGDPDLETSFLAADAAIKAGADFLELGVPFSDPSADGPVIQRAMERALKHGTHMSSVLDVYDRLRARHPALPMLLFGYANPFFRAQSSPLRERLLAVDGVLLVDVPPEHGADFTELSEQLDWIRLLGPNATPARRQKIAAAASGFIYLVGMTGVTGGQMAADDVSAIAEQVTAMRPLTKVPICVGFGIKSEADARRLACVGDGIVAGSVFVEDIARADLSDPKRETTVAAVSATVTSLRHGLDA